MIKKFLVDIYRNGILDAVHHALDKNFVPNGLGVLWVFRHLKIWGVRTVVPGALAIKYLSCAKKISKINIWISVFWSGGAVAYLENQLKQNPSDEVSLVVGSVRRKGQLGVHVWKNGRKFFCFFINSFMDLYSLKAKCLELVINHTVDLHTFYSHDPFSADEYHQVIEDILKMASCMDVPMRFFMHDYFSVCPRISLTNENVVYCQSEYSMEHCSQCLLTTKGCALAFQQGIDIDLWRNEFSRLLHSCKEVRAFSEDTFKRVDRIYPNLSLSLIPHRPLLSDVKIPHSQKERLVIGVVGKIIGIKGARQVYELAHYLDKMHSQAKIVVVGTIANHDAEDSRLIVTGPYKQEDLTKIIEQEGVNLVFFSSVCPETFSYVTQEIISRKMPIVCYPFGAPKDAVASYEHGSVIPEVTAEATWRTIKTLAQKEGIVQK